ncbi:hypothetical protein [Mycolicibacterium sphagni]|uniref:Uncharacterized protein n=1 Tax=Mycolicibacterium sphagni TaxID=1786 RepID=A0ABX2JTS5_9MYCO|nr:hypothetical protein [Mycolicibacterium sphagni]NTY61103.1 hypothetical protein [Mycolicibacterium sphagni]
MTTGDSIDGLSPAAPVDGELDRDFLSLEEFRKPPALGRFAAGEVPAWRGADEDVEPPSFSAAAGRLVELRGAARGPDALA